MAQINEDASDYLEEANNDIQRYFAKHDPPTYFYYCLLGELVKIFGMAFIMPDKDYNAEFDEDLNLIPNSLDDYSYKNQIGYCLAMAEGTCGWFEAFKQACAQCNLTDMFKYYNNLDWIRSDIFDGVLADKMIEVLFDGSIRSDYCKFLIDKEKLK